VALIEGTIVEHAKHGRGAVSCDLRNGRVYVHTKRVIWSTGPLGQENAEYGFGCHESELKTIDPVTALGDVVR
jgi:succinate dehydrogenase/fumarate reductase flavoprotein subunit